MTPWQELFGWVLASSIMGSLLVILIFIVKYLVKDRLSPRWHYLIWLLLLIRLLMPVLPSTSLSIYNFVPIDLVKTSFPTSTNFPWVEKPGTGNGLTMDTSSSMIQSRPGVPEIEIFTLFSWLWVAMVVVLAVRLLIMEVRFRINVKRVRKVGNTQHLVIFEACKRKLGIKNASLWETDSVQSPVLFGLVRPRFLMPVNLADKLNPEELTH